MARQAFHPFSLFDRLKAAAQKALGAAIGGVPHTQGLRHFFLEVAS
jgi:hypothetical protein